MKRSLVFGLCAFLSLLLLTQYLAYQQYRILQSELSKKVVHELNSVSSRLEKTLSYGLSATNTLAFILETYGVPNDFDSIAKNILKSHKYIDALQMTEKGVITHVYPMEGNEKALGFDVLNDPVAGIEARKSIEIGQLFFAGPLELKQGGVAIIGRLPVYLEGDFFGFSAVIVRLSTLLDAIGIDGANNGHFKYQLSKFNPTTSIEEFFLPEYDVNNKSQISASIEVPDGEWKLYVSPISSNTHYYNAFGFALLGMVLSTVVGFFVAYWAKEPEKLRKIVELKTKALVASERYFRALIENSVDAIILMDEKGKVLYQSPATERICGYSLAEMQSIDGMELIHPDDREREMALFESLVLSPGQTILRSHRFRHNSGRYIWTEGTYSNLLNDPSIRAIVYNFHDVTTRIHAELAINREKYLSDSIINSLPGVFYLYDRKGKFLRWNKNFEVVSGYTSSEISKMHPLDFYDIEEKELLRQKIESVFIHGSDEVEACLLTKGNRKIHYYFNGCRTYIDDKEYLIGMGIDITKRREAEKEAIAVFKEKETTLNRISDAVISLDREWRYLYLNDAALASHPLGREGTIGKTLLEAHPELEGTKFWEIYQESMDTLTVKEAEFYYEPLHTWFSFKAYPTSDGITIFYRDITDRKKIQEETLHLVGRELHDNIIQVLTGAGLYLNIARQQENTETNPHLDEVDILIKRAITEIRNLSHDLISPFIDGDTLIDALERIFKQTNHGTGIVVESRFIEFHEDKLQDQFKLCLLRITQEQFNNIIKYSTATKVNFELKSEKGELKLVIEDNGIGFDPSEKKKGVGLHNIETRATLYNGVLDIQSQPGKGCKLTVVFPMRKKSN